MDNHDDRSAAKPPFTHTYIQEDELAIIEKRRQRLFPDSTSKKRDTIGLALSGGGIRSAVTNLGVLYEMSRVGLFKTVDYMSTVSGGGYIGCCLAALLSLRKPIDKANNYGKEIYSFKDDTAEESLFSGDWESFPFRDLPFQSPPSFAKDTDDTDSSDTEFCHDFSSRSQIYHMRNRASYLIPRNLLFSADTIRMIGATISTTLLPLLWFLSLITVISTLYMMTTLPQWRYQFADDAKKSNQEKQQSYTQTTPPQGQFPHHYHFIPASVPEKSTTIEAPSYTEKAADSLKSIKVRVTDQFSRFFDGTISSAILVITALLSFIWGCAIHRLSGYLTGIFREKPHPNEVTESYDSRILLRNTAILSIIFYGVLLFAVAVRTYTHTPTFLPDPRFLILPWFALWNCIGSLVRYCSLTCRCEKDENNKRCWTRIDRSQTAMFTGLFFYSIPVTLALAIMPAFIAIGNKGYLAVVLALIAAAIKLFLSQKDGTVKKKSGSAFQAQFAKIVRWLMALTVPFFIFLAIIGVCCLIKDHSSQLYAIAAGMDGEKKDGIMFFYLLCLLASSLLSFFLSWMNFNRISPHIFYMDRLSEAFLRTYRVIQPPGSHYHHCPPTILAARNSIDMALSDLHGTLAGDKEEPAGCAARGPYLLINATLNMTAVRDLKGFRRQSTDFLFSRCYTGSERTGYIPTSEYRKPEIRLRRAMAVSGAAVTSVRGAGGNMAESFACTILGVRLGYWLRHPAEMLRKKDLKPWNILNLFYELFRYTNTRRKHIYLSDGGHCGDNLGLMPLLRRKVKLIIASDAECDPDYLFNSLNNSIRRAYVDKNIKITIDLGNLTPDKDGYSPKHYTIGRVFYPERPWQKSWILIIKNGLTGRESAPIKNYKTKSPSFPHETTADQFFTEEQFEAYRSLGREACQEIRERCQATFRSDQWLRDPWSKTDEFCETLMQSCYPEEDKKTSDQNPFPWEKKSHCWDDIILSIWRCELGTFSNWEGFSQTISKCYNAMISEDDFQCRSEMERQLTELNQWLIDNLGRFEQLNKQFDVPRNWQHFEDVKTSL